MTALVIWIPVGLWCVHTSPLIMHFCLLALCTQSSLINVLATSGAHSHRPT